MCDLLKKWMKIRFCNKVFSTTDISQENKQENIFYSKKEKKKKHIFIPISPKNHVTSHAVFFNTQILSDFVN